jgi:hypothetical protein
MTPLANGRSGLRIARGRASSGSHELPSSEGRKVLSGEFKPLAVLAALMKTPVAIFLNSSGVVGFDRVDDLRRFGKVDDKLAFTTAERVRSANLIDRVPARVQPDGLIGPHWFVRR